jgi:hypothetical protein
LFSEENLNSSSTANFTKSKNITCKVGKTLDKNLENISCISVRSSKESFRSMNIDTGRFQDEQKISLQVPESSFIREINFDKKGGYLTNRNQDRYNKLLICRNFEYDGSLSQSTYYLAGQQKPFMQHRRLKSEKFLTSATKHKINAIICKNEKSSNKENQEFEGQVKWSKLVKKSLKNTYRHPQNCIN